MITRSQIIIAHEDNQLAVYKELLLFMQNTKYANALTDYQLIPQAINAFSKQITKITNPSKAAKYIKDNTQ